VGVADWDVVDVDARDGARVEAGAEALHLVDATTVRLLLSPTPEDLASLTDVFRRGEPLDAEPLVAGTGPELAGLKIGGLQGAPWIEAANASIGSSSAGEGVELRTWALREGLRYIVRVPIARLEGRIVLPADAVVTRGADLVVVRQDGKTFTQVPVHVEYSDARVVVVAADGAVFPGDRIVTKGAYVVALALQAAAGGGVDPHAGHNH
jgi:cobalt-zinc-cadmium efflux system membrane fusion protein